MSTFTIEVNDHRIQANEGETILSASRRAGIEIPTLCHLDCLPASGACRMCVVEVDQMANLIPSCVYPVTAGMKIQTHSRRAVRARKTIVELLLANHPDDCLYCTRNGTCQLQKFAQDLRVRERHYEGERIEHPLDVSSPSIVRDPDKCILCGRCVRVCEEIQSVAAIDFTGRGSRARISTAFDEGLNLSSCVNCGQCIMVCPTGALRVQRHIKRVMEAVADPRKHVVVQHAPSISVTIGESFGLPPGIDVAGKLTAALRRIGFDRVFDTAFCADLTIVEEASELVQRIRTGGVLPMMTSCSPGWIKFVEQFFPDMVGHLSTCKSPQQMLGALIKDFYAQRQGISPDDIYSVSIMPCVAKKFEAERPEMARNGNPDIDAVLVTRELVHLIRSHGLDLEDLPSETADDPFGERATAGKIFGASGGVMEAAVRTAYFQLTNRELEHLEVEAVRGIEAIKEAHLQVNGMELGVAVANGLGAARTLVEQIRRGRDDLHFIEVMSCPGGCIAGGGQPIGTSAEAIKKRAQALYQLDETEAIRQSHRNPSVQRIYDEYLKVPLGDKSHHLLHTHYHERKVLV